MSMSDSSREDLKNNANKTSARTYAGRNANATHDRILGTEPEGRFHQPPNDQRVQRDENKKQEDANTSIKSGRKEGDQARRLCAYN